MPQHEQNGCAVLFTRHRSTKIVTLFRYSDWLSRFWHLKLELLKICKACCVNGGHGTNITNIKISRHTFVCHYSWNVLAKFDENRSNK